MMHISCVSGTLDYETTKEYTLVLKVEDGGTTPQLSTDITLRVQVNAVNDGGPSFSPSKAHSIFNMWEGEYVSC